ncbi:DUF481 domain-containing protein [Paraliomyxa miuraensis]|uniref:DUF481 domain-containing protein n=1 Tax=Paraliomyxa miuraensis TaxID=376150 RepID=UPI0022539B85|nr:DUF481 domain-containing protein [Paraliomyxa miuraensis]
MLWPTLASASVNFEKRRRALVRPGWSMGIDLHGGLRRGNLNVLELGGGEFVGWQADRLGFLLLGEHRFRAQTLARAGQGFSDLPRSRQLNAHMGHLRLFHRLGPRLSVEAFTQVEADELSVLRWRQLVGTGLRLRVIERDGLSLHLGTAYVPELEILDRALFLGQPGGHGPINVWQRVGQVIDASVGRGPVTLVNTFYVQPRIDDPRDVRVLDEASLVIAVSKHVSLELAGSVRVDTRPPSYCAVPVGTGGCAPELVRRVVGTEVAVDPALAVSF